MTQYVGFDPLVDRREFLFHRDHPSQPVADDGVTTESGSDRVTILAISTFRSIRDPVATAPGTDVIVQPSRQLPASKARSSKPALV